MINTGARYKPEQNKRVVNFTARLNYFLYSLRFCQFKTSDDWLAFILCILRKARKGWLYLLVCFLLIFSGLIKRSCWRSEALITFSKI